MLVLRSHVSARETRSYAAGFLQLPQVRTELARRSFYFNPRPHLGDATPQTVFLGYTLHFFAIDV